MSGAPVDSIAVVIDTRRDPLRRRLDDREPLREVVGDRTALPPNGLACR